MGCTTEELRSDEVRGHADGGATPGQCCRNAFSRRYLQRVLERDQPPTAPQAAVAGPWEVAPVQGGRWAVWRLGEEGRAEPAAVLDEEQDALLLAAVLPGSADATVVLDPRRGPDGYRVRVDGRDAGRLAWFDPALAAALAVARRVVASPRCLASLLDAAGHDALEHAGRLLAGRREEG